MSELVFICGRPARRTLGYYRLPQPLESADGRRRIEAGATVTYRIADDVEVYVSTEYEGVTVIAPARELAEMKPR